MTIKHKYVYLVIFFIFYITIGIVFSILKSNSYYEYIVLDEDIYQKNNQSYWDNRCIEENNNPSNKGNPWCWDINGNFHTTKPDRSQWYFDFMLKNKSRIISPIFLWPLHFIGLDMIHFKSIAGSWVS